MKNIMIILMSILMSILSMSSIALSPDSVLCIDTIKDEYIDVSDPRIGSLILVGKNSKSKYYQINFNGLDGKIIAQNLANIFLKNNINYELITNSNLSQQIIRIDMIKNEEK